MTPEEITAVFDRYREAIDRRDAVAVAAFYADNCIVESPAFGRLVGPAAVENSFQRLFSTFPDFATEYREFLVAGNRAVQAGTNYGTDTGGLLGQAPTGNPFRFFTVIIFELSDRQIVHERRIYDVSGLLRQLATGPGLPEEVELLYRNALATARLEHELAIAAQIQQALLPAAQYSGADFEVAAASLPCRAIGGDFLDYYDLPTGAFGFALGDVSGKGPPAGLLAAKIQGILGACSRLPHTPSEMLARVNEELGRRSVESRFATLLYAMLCDGRLTYASAGHNPPLLVGRHDVRRLDQGGLILGAFPNASFDEETVPLDPGDVLVLFSDGITEALNPTGSEFGEERLLGCVRAHRESTPTILLQTVLASVREFIGSGEQSDDLTALILRYTGS
jgi:predicted ester cyclase